jgi:hypothetical protein
VAPGLALGTEFAMRLAAVRSRAASLPGPGQIRALEAAALAKPRQAMTPAEIRALAAESIAHLHEVALGAGSSLHFSQRQNVGSGEVDVRQL